MALPRGNVQEVKNVAAVADADENPFGSEGVPFEVAATPEPTVTVVTATPEPTVTTVQVSNSTTTTTALGTSQALAPATGKAAVEARASANAAAVSAMEGEGFEGLELGFGSFPIMKLENEGKFMTTEGHDFGTEFDAVIMSTRNKFVCKNTMCAKRDEEAVYSYDKVNSTEGRPMDEIFAEWKEKGWGHEWKKYLEAPAQIVGGEHDGLMVMLSLPPTSINRFSGFVMTQKFQKNKSPSQFVTRCFRGDKVEKVDYPFYPWAFSFSRLI